MNEPNAEPGRRRRRRRGPSGADVPTPTDLARAADAARHDAAEHDVAKHDAARHAEPAEGRGKPRRRESAGLRSLVGAGPSQLGVSGALRGRDVNRPTDEDLAEAERDVQLVRRHWQPPS